MAFCLPLIPEPPKDAWSMHMRKAQNFISSRLWARSKAHRVCFVAGQDVQDGVLTSAALLKHNHPDLLPVKLKGAETLSSRPPPRVALC